MAFKAGPRALAAARRCARLLANRPAAAVALGPAAAPLSAPAKHPPPSRHLLDRVVGKERGGKKDNSAVLGKMQPEMQNGVGDPTALTDLEVH